jgi:hypothetical protein
VLGAYGAAISLQEKMHLEGKRKPLQGSSAISDRMTYSEKFATQILSATMSAN